MSDEGNWGRMRVRLAVWWRDWGAEAIFVCLFLAAIGICALAAQR